MALKKSKVKAKTHTSFLYGRWVKFFLIIIALVSFVYTFFPDSIHKWVVDFQPIMNERCLQPFYKDIPPYLNKNSLRVESYPLCFDGFSLMYSDVSKTALWVAERLTPDHLRFLSGQPQHLETKHSDLVIQAQNSGKTPENYYLWQLAPMDNSSNLQNDRSLYQGDTLALISPEKRALLLNVEHAIRAVVEDYNVKIYMITGPAFLSPVLKTMDNGGLIPTAVFKVIYIPKTGVIGAYYVPNDNALKSRIVSVCYLEERLGMNLFPQLTEEEKRNTYKLPWRVEDIHPNHPIEYLYWDAESQCAEDVTEEKIIQSKIQFQKSRQFS
jgi:endonuclease G, mitochondrial